MELVQELTQKLGINQQQASGGLGLLMGMARNKLGGDFGQVAQHVPDVDGLIDSAPRSQATGSPVTGALGAIGGMLGGGKTGGLGALGGLAGGFQQLGMDAGMIGKFIPIVMGFLQSRGGNSAAGLLQKALA